jgi:hypothetical protein
MRIIGGRDYYDSALSYGHDPSLVFVRGETLLEAEEAARHGLFSSHLGGLLRAERDAAEPDGPRRHGHRWPGTAGTGTVRVRGTEYSLSFPTVIVAGRRYQGIRAEVGRLVRAAGVEPSVTYCWSEPQFSHWLRQHQLAFGADDDARRAYFKPASVPAPVRELVMERRWTILARDPCGGWCELSRAWPRAPWHVDRPVLRHVGFARAVPPHLLFQEIEMWLGGVLADAGKPLITVSDRDRAAKHGMDHTSFRRPPTKRR